MVSRQDSSQDLGLIALLTLDRSSNPRLSVQIITNLFKPAVFSQEGFTICTVQVRKKQKITLIGRKMKGEEELQCSDPSHWNGQMCNRVGRTSI